MHFCWIIFDKLIWTSIKIYWIIFDKMPWVIIEICWINCDQIPGCKSLISKTSKKTTLHSEKLEWWLRIWNSKLRIVSTWKLLLGTSCNFNDCIFWALHLDISWILFTDDLLLPQLLRNSCQFSQIGKRISYCAIRLLFEYFCISWYLWAFHYE